jgi:DNA-binding Lrp family transcriptional regulator
MWFTLQADSAAQINATLTDLCERFGSDFHSLPVKRFFKLHVLFNAESENQVLLQDVERIPEPDAVELSDRQKLVLSQLQRPLELTEEPLDLPYGGDIEQEDALKIISGLLDTGVIRRIAAVVNHRKLGYVANVMFVAEVVAGRIVRAGERLARLPIVSHCYERETFKGWPYNLFAMCHGRSADQIQHVVSKFTEAERIDSYQLLETAAELKKKPVKHKFD